MATKIPHILKCITNSRTHVDRKFHKLRLHELVLNKRYISAKKRSAIAPLPKERRRLCAESPDSIFQDCSVCLGNNLVNIMFSDMVSINFTLPDRFICADCSHLDLPNIITIVPVHKLPIERCRIWLYRIGLKRKAICPCCKSTSIDMMDATWHVSHDVARKNGGTLDLDNLFVFCCNCNLAMGICTVEEYNGDNDGGEEEQKVEQKDSVMSKEVIDGLIILLRG